MRQYLPYNILLIIAVAVSALMVFYNLALRETFAITVRYALPAIAAVSEEQQVLSVDEARKYTEEEPAQEEAQWQDDAEDSQKLYSVQFPLDINEATVEQLLFIPQVGNVMAQRIVQYRDVLGGYTDLEQLRGIKGVGDKTFAKISGYLYVAEENLTQGTEESGDTN